MQVRVGDRITLIGTAHVSAKSVQEVRETIQALRPRRVLVELDANRLRSLLDPDALRAEDLLELIRQGKQYQLLLQLYLANHQARIGEETGVSPGAELLEAVRVAQELDIPVDLIDRDIRTTMQRLLGSLGFFRRISLASKFLGQAFSSSDDKPELNVDDLLEQDAITALGEELAKDFPEAKRIVLDERDTYMASAVHDAAKTGSVVAVVGAGHAPGMQRILESLKPREKLPKEHLNAVPSKRIAWGKVIAGGLTALVLGAFATVAYQGGLDELRDAGLYWIIANGTLSALGAALARGHPLAVLTAFIAAPLTSLSPALAAGWFAGLAQYRLRRPMGEDVANLRNLRGIRDIYQNRLMRVLLVVALANVGSSIGTFIGLGELLRRIGG